MRYGSMVTGGCLALLSLLRLDRGDVGAALLLAAVAAAALLWGVLGSGARERAEAARPADPAVEVARARTWRRIALLGLALSAVGAFTFPPMGLVVGALTLYAASQMRRSSRMLAARPAA
jgi:hypothetical protein